MTTYTPYELRSMAIRVQQAKAQGDARAELIVLMLAARTGLHPNEVATRIAELAQTETTAK